MGILAALRLTDTVAPTAGASTVWPSGSTAETIDPVAAAAFGIPTATELDVVTRTEAMTVPSVRRGRAIICGTIGSLPLVSHRIVEGGSVELVDRPLLAQPNPDVTRAHLLTWTVDDLLFHGCAWWRVTGRDHTGYPVQVERIEPHRIMVELTRGQVYVDGQETPDRDLIRLDGPDEGVLRYGGRTLRTAIMLEDAVRRYARLDVPLGVLRLQEGAQELDQAAIDDLLDSWEDARRKRSTAYLNRAVDYQALQFDAEKTQLSDARQYAVAEIARLMSLPPRYLNAPSASSLTYSTVEGERRDLGDTTLSPYLAAIEQRLSMGDVTPRGQSVRFDLTAWLRGDTLSTLQAAEIAIRSGVVTRDEVRQDWLGRPPLPPGTPAPEPDPAPTEAPT